MGTVYNSLELYRLERCVQRLKEDYRLDAPEIIKKAELLLIIEICNNLLIDLKLKGDN